MSEKITSTMAEQSSTSMNGSHQNKDNYLILQEPIEGTPFYITGNQTTGYFLRMGHYRLTEYIPDSIIISEKPTANKEEIMNYFLDYLEEEKWNIVLTMIAAAAHMNNEPTVEVKKEKIPQ